jgi:putative hemolysin
MEEVNRVLKVELSAPGVETVAGLVTQQLGRLAEAGDRVDLDGVVADVLDVHNSRPTRIRFSLPRRDANSAAGGAENACDTLEPRG